MSQDKSISSCFSTLFGILVTIFLLFTFATKYYRYEKNKRIKVENEIRRLSIGDEVFVEKIGYFESKRTRVRYSESEFRSESYQFNNRKWKRYKFENELFKYTGQNKNLWNPILINSDSTNLYFVVDKLPTIKVPSNKHLLFDIIPNDLLTNYANPGIDYNFHFQHKDFLDLNLTYTCQNNGLLGTSNKVKLWTSNKISSESDVEIVMKSFPFESKKVKILLKTSDVKIKPIVQTKIFFAEYIPFEQKFIITKITGERLYDIPEGKVFGLFPIKEPNREKILLISALSSLNLNYENKLQADIYNNIYGIGLPQKRTFIEPEISKSGRIKFYSNNTSNFLVSAFGDNWTGTFFVDSDTKLIQGVDFVYSYEPIKRVDQVTAFIY